MRVDTLHEQLLALIESMKDRLPARLPSEQELCKRFGASINTLRNALEPFKRSGCVDSVRGRGNVVVFPPSRRQHEGMYVLIVAGDPGHPYNMVSISAASVVLQERGYTPAVLMPDEFCALISKGNFPQQALGVIMIGEFDHKKIAEVCNSTNLDVVLIGEIFSPIPQRSGAVIDNVVFDHTSQSYCATSYLLRQGHRRIALALPCPLEDILGHSLQIWYHEVMRGYLHALREEGIELHREWFIHLPGVTGFQSADAERQRLCHEQNNKAISAWGGQTPTALLHTEHSEAFLLDMVEMFIPGHFTLKNMVGLMSRENLQVGFSGYSDTLVSCYHIADLVREALGCLLSRYDHGQKSQPRRIVLQESELWQRTHGKWSRASDSVEVTALVSSEVD